MEITEIRIFPVEGEKLKAYVAIAFDNCFLVRDIRIIQNGSSYFISMPNKKTDDGIYQDIAHPINKETRGMIERKILQQYHQMIQSKGVALKTAAVSDTE